MSPTAKMATVFIIVLAVALGVYYWYVNQPANLNGGLNDIGMAPAREAAPGTILTTGSDASDTALDQDLSAIDAQLSGLEADAASVGSSLGDEPITQSNL